MTISSQPIADRVYRITLSGLLTWAEFQSFLAQAETANVFATGKVKLLLLLEDFTGWEPGEQWSDVSFFFKHDPDIERIAVVGESRWWETCRFFSLPITDKPKSNSLPRPIGDRRASGS